MFDLFSQFEEEPKPPESTPAEESITLAQLSPVEETKPQPATIPTALSPSEVSALIRSLLESTFPYPLLIEGEVSNLSRPSSGHVFFNLKDEGASLRCVIFRSGVPAAGARNLRDGIVCRCYGTLTTYPGQSCYQLLVSKVVPLGLGDAEAARRELYRKLAAEGLFAPERKRPLPTHPRVVGIVTSPTGAAVRDFLRVARRRDPSIHIIIAPCRVQGEEAAAEIVEALEAVQGMVDAVMVGRGGGSAEDLSCFDDEAVVRAVATCTVPVVAAVGHEIDHPLVENAADVVAATPSMAAELMVPLARERDERLYQVSTALYDASRRALSDIIAGFTTVKRGLNIQHLRLEVTMQEQAVENLRHRLRERAPDKILLPQYDARVGEYLSRIKSMAPRAVLERGYALVEGADGISRPTAALVADGEELSIVFADGKRKAIDQGVKE
jgi:exodeoxyribonuclease VII large subunit